MSKVKEIKKVLDTKCENEPKEFAVVSMAEALGVDFGRVPIWMVVAPGAKYGAYGILHRQVQDEVYEKVGGDYWIIPSSIHEVLCISKDMFKLDELVQIVKFVNSDQVAPEDQLADAVWSFTYDSYGNGVIE